MPFVEQRSPPEINLPTAAMKFPRTINFPAAVIVARARHRNCTANPACRASERSSRVIKSSREKIRSLTVSAAKVLEHDFVES